MTIQYYKKKNPRTGVDDFYEVGSDRYIGPSEYGNGSDFVEQGPPKTQPRDSGLSQYKRDSSFLSMLKEAIQRKQNNGKDIASARSYWGAQQRDPMTFTDERLRLLSPTQQQSLREKKYATAGAHMSALNQEEQSRGNTMQDILDEVRGAKQDELSKRQEDRLQRAEAFNEAMKLKGTGYTFNGDGLQTDTSGSTAKQITNAIKMVESGGNYNSSGLSGEYGAYQYMPRTWAGYSADYNNAVNKVSGMLPMTKENQDKVTEWKVQNWLNQGYTPQQIASMWNAGGGRPDAYKQNWRGTKNGVSYDTPGYVKKVMTALKKEMGTPEDNDWIEPTDADIKKAVKYSGKTEAYLKANGYKTVDQYNMLIDASRSALFTLANQEVNKLKESGKTVLQAKADLVEEFGDRLSTTEINSILDAYTKHKSSFDNTLTWI